MGSFMTKEEAIKYSVERRANLVNRLEDKIYEEIKERFVPDRDFEFEDHLSFNSLEAKDVDELKTRLEKNGFSVIKMTNAGFVIR